jgi:hypothetical protein
MSRLLGAFIGASEIELDGILDILDRRRKNRELEQDERDREQAEKMEAEDYAKKHCSKCGSYLSCRERREHRCDSCRLRALTY